MEMVEVSGIEDPPRLPSSAASSRITTTTPAPSWLLASCLTSPVHLPRFVKVLPVDYKRVMEEEAAKAAARRPSSRCLKLPIIPASKPRSKETKAAKLQDIEDSIRTTQAEKKRSALILDKTRGFHEVPAAAPRSIATPYTRTKRLG